MIAIIIIWLGMTAASYSIYSMWTGAASSNILGFTVSGTIGTVLAIWLAGINYLQNAINNVIALNATYGEYMLVIGYVFWILVLCYNGAVYAPKDGPKAMVQ